MNFFIISGYLCHWYLHGFRLELTYTVFIPNIINLYQQFEFFWQNSVSGSNKMLHNDQKMYEFHYLCMIFTIFIVNSNNLNALLKCVPFRFINGLVSTCQTSINYKSKSDLYRKNGLFKITPLMGRTFRFFQTYSSISSNFDILMGMQLLWWPLRRLQWYFSGDKYGLMPFVYRFYEYGIYWLSLSLSPI